MEHIIPLTKNGNNDIENLALACFHCNRNKFDKTRAIDAQSDVEVPLFNPRQDSCSEHFIWSWGGDKDA
ncbi:HNH endonuclease signature motif containing protein [Microcoleus sp. K5-D4]|uniref:HNH endonuclease signature motif containing protein n=1 Tax=Microcoleus sp. K5-D4 TaxID=2818801 RepID=UPI002FD39C9F